jgi:hypothetical protein
MVKHTPAERPILSAKGLDKCIQECLLGTSPKSGVQRTPTYTTGKLEGQVQRHGKESLPSGHRSCSTYLSFIYQVFRELLGPAEYKNELQDSRERVAETFKLELSKKWGGLNRPDATLA